MEGGEDAGTVMTERSSEAQQIVQRTTHTINTTSSTIISLTPPSHLSSLSTASSQSILDPSPFPAPIFNPICCTMEGLFRSYSTPVRKTLRRENRSIAEWREKGKYQPFDLATAVERMSAPDRAVTWHGPSRKSAWSPAASDEYDVVSENYIYNTPAVTKRNNKSNDVVPEVRATDYFSAVPRTTIAETELFAEEPLAADIPEAELESSRRRSIELERQPLFLETKEDDALVEDLILHLADPTLDSSTTRSSKAAPEKPKDVPTPAPVKVEEAIDTKEPPSPEDIIETSPQPAPKPRAPAPSARDRFMKAKKILFTVDVLKKCIPPAPLPDELIPDEPRSRKPKAVKAPVVAPKKEVEVSGMVLEVVEKVAKVAEVAAPAVVEVKEEATVPVVGKVEEVAIVEVPVVEEVIAEETTQNTTQEVTETVVEESTEKPIPTIVIEEVAKETVEVAVEEVEAVSPLEGGVSLSPSPVHLFPESPRSLVRSDEGYLSGGDSDSESDFGVSLPVDNYYQEDPSTEDEAPLPEDIIANYKHTPRENEPYQHHCLLHGHFFPKAGPLRSAGFPSEPFNPWISCDRCQRQRLAEAWQCSLLNQCGMIVCTPCHDELEYGVIKKPTKAPSLILDAKVDGVREGLELGMQRGLKIGFEVGLAGKAKEIVERQEREKAKQRAAAMKKKEEEEEDEMVGVRGHRSWEAVPKQARRMLSMGF
ncbi:hypothetical protein K440DRAFT_108682 [Wilcoxina mikolae CBS 423.85]|nr:hypothetical protein K440DRAFT_108682 [Wilcoxina mikolae CBS 423.85]